MPDDNNEHDMDTPNKGDVGNTASCKHYAFLGLVLCVGMWYTKAHIERAFSFVQSQSIMLTEALREPSYDQSRLACMILSFDENWFTRLKALNETWGPTCDVPLYFYTQIFGQKPLPGGVALPAHEGRLHLTNKMMAAFKYALSLKPPVQWFLKADDDSYIIIERLKAVLKQYDPAQAYYLGRAANVTEPYMLQEIQRLKHLYWDILNVTDAALDTKVFNSGGAGYILSRKAAIELLNGVNDPDFRRRRACARDGGIEDLDVGHCLANLGVPATPVLDPQGRTRLHMGLPELVKCLDRREKPPSSLLTDLISVHRMYPKRMYFLHEILSNASIV